MDNTDKQQADSRLVAAATALAAEFHAGQVDKAGQPYILHPVRVALRCETVEQRVVALLHDAIEDAGSAAEEVRRMLRIRKTLRAHVAESGVHPMMGAIETLTRYKETYKAFIGRIAATAGTAEGAIAIPVKIADLTDNMDLDRLPEHLLEAGVEMVRSRYFPARLRLEAALAKATRAA